MFIIIKPRREPLIIGGLRAALSRIHPQHDIVPRLQSAYSSRMSGFAGEERVDRVFQSYTFPGRYKIFNGLSLKSSTDFQIDSLFLTPSFAVIFETKNIAGSILVKENPPQLVQTLDSGETKAYNSPISQVQSNIELLQDWFYSRTISLPIYGAVVLVFPKKEVHVHDTVIPFLYPNAIPSYIRNLPSSNPILDEKTFSQVVHELIQGDGEYIPQSICSTYSLTKNDFSTGVRCPSCHSFGMQKYRAGWICPSCNKKNTDAHIQAIHDWFLLFGEKMTNKDCREFLNVPQRSTATRILQSMKLHAEGEKRNRTYSITTK
ncbi:nuclease-related domain-containing protein [Sporosarcina sp. CAU 1771]